MCSGSTSSLPKLPGASSLFEGNSEAAKATRRIDPMGAFMATGNKGNLDPLNLNNAPNVPDPLPPTQDGNTASFAASKMKRPGAQQTVLGGAAGGFQGAPVARNTLLGG